jgi:undecaprenyl diphosphate synthase
MSENLPKHIAIIMDGNGRWAAKRGLPKLAGHREGIESLRDTIKYCREIGVPILTVYAFSTENWNRPRLEVDTLMGFVDKHLNLELDTFINGGIRVNFIGRLDKLPPSVIKTITNAMDKTSGCSDMILNVALNYGSRSEIVDAVNSLIKEGRGSVDEAAFGDYLYTKGISDPDLLIRTSGERRISNFLLWQISYAELYFTDTLWPDFRRDGLKKAIEEYKKRDRCFGGARR